MFWPLNWVARLGVLRGERFLGQESMFDEGSLPHLAVLMCVSV